MMRRVLHFAAPIVLLAAAVISIGLADQHASIADLTRTATHSLRDKSVEVLNLLTGPISITAFVPDEPDLRTGLRQFFMPYRRHKPDLHLAFVDPRLAVDTTRNHGAKLGEILIEYEGRVERLTRLTEIEVSSALARLARGADRWITFLANNGERRVEREANDDLTRFAQLLEQRGLSVREYTLARNAIPADTAVLVLASPSVAYLPTEIEAITGFVAAGGNLLWLTEPDAPEALDALEAILGIKAYLGTVVDPVGLTKFRNLAYAVGLQQPAHPVLAGFNQTVVFPFAAALAAGADTDWAATTLAHTEDMAWTETGRFKSNVSFDAPDEVQSQLKLAIALSRPSHAAGAKQRVVVIGDGDFLSNRYVDSVGNLEFGRRVLEWLATDDALIDIAVPAILDAEMNLEMWQRLSIFLFFAVGLPFVFALNGGLLWWRQRRA